DSKITMENTQKIQKTVTKSAVNRVYELYDELDALQTEANDAINLAKQNEENVISVVRKNGETQNIKESDAWEEIWVLGNQTESYGVMAEKYPEAFEKSTLATEKANEVDTFTFAEIGIKSNKVTLRDILRLVEGVVNYTLEENGKQQQPKSE